MPSSTAVAGTALLAPESLRSVYERIQGATRIPIQIQRQGVEAQLPLRIE